MRKKDLLSGRFYIDGEYVTFKNVKDYVSKAHTMTTQGRLDLFREITKGTRLSPMYNDLRKNGFFEVCASRNFHGAYAGGLFDHSLAMAVKLSDMTKRMGLEWTEEDSPLVVSFLHDLCKVDDYEFDNDNNVWVSKSKKIVSSGHGGKSIQLIDEFLLTYDNGIKITDEELACIRYHMGAFVSQEMCEYGDMTEEYENVMWTHSADMYVSRVLGI